jgi:lipopolysaccharide transport system ATP-binding protein
MYSLSVENVSKVFLKKKKVRGMLVPWGFATAAGGKQGTNCIWALKEVSFRVRPGTVVGVIGPNGAGKSTLLKLVSRITPPTSGRIRGRGRVIALLEMGLGFLPDLTGRENVYLSGALHGLSVKDINKNYDKIVDFADLHDFMDLSVSRYSSGMYLRLAFSIAVNMEPDILLADEVLAVGDQRFQERCLQRTREEAETGKTVLFVSHDMQAIARLCDEVIYLNAGRLVAQGSPLEMIGRYQEAQGEYLEDQAQAGENETSGFVNIIAVRLLGADGSEIATVSVSRDFAIEITFDLAVEGAMVRPSIDFYVGNVLVFSTGLPAATPVGKPGRYTASVSVPSRFLADTVYSASVCVACDASGERAKVKKYNALNFKVYDDLAVAEGMNEFRKKPARGVIAPHLEWRMDCVGEATARKISGRVGPVMAISDTCTVGSPQ